MTFYRKLTQQDLVLEARERFGPDPMSWAFQCPNCRDVATMDDFRAANVDLGRAGQECIGRHVAGRGCDWVAYGLIRGPWEIVVAVEGDRPERSIWGFSLAPDPGDEPAWMAVARCGLPAHRLVFDSEGAPTGTPCGRSVRTGIQHTVGYVAKRYAATWCPKCWPSGPPISSGGAAS